MFVIFSYSDCYFKCKSWIYFHLDTKSHTNPDAGGIFVGLVGMADLFGDCNCRLMNSCHTAHTDFTAYFTASILPSTLSA